MVALKTEPYMNDWLWLYRGAWHEWEIHEIDMAVPLSPDEVLLKGTLYCTINRKRQ
jgi:glucosamine-6-phosphate deaminase